MQVLLQMGYDWSSVEDKYCNLDLDNLEKQLKRQKNIALKYPS